MAFDYSRLRGKIVEILVHKLALQLRWGGQKERFL